MLGLGELADMVWRKWDCRLEPPWEKLPRSFDFSPQGKSHCHQTKIAEEVIDCIERGVSAVVVHAESLTPRAEVRSPAASNSSAAQ